MKKAKHIRIPMAAVVAALFAVGVVGCSENEEKSAQTSQKPQMAAQSVKAKPQSAQTQQPADKPAVKAAKNDNSPITVKKQTPKVKQTANGKPGNANVTAKPQTEKMPETPQDNNQQSIEERRAETENLIYAVIRVKMEEMIEERATLLKQGVSPSDPKIRDLEGSIMKARELLIENGEVVEEIDPPIVQRVPRK